ncbi:MAG: DNA-binding protein [Deltaproteobacteria bacterium]|nr:MAG: DNA-binding protein [Deltaproteobacteria bacterium]
MITFVDTNILLDIFLPDPEFGESSANALETAFQSGSLVINEIVYAELAPQFDDRHTLDNILEGLGIRIVLIDKETTFAAGQLWKKYRAARGNKRRILADFLIGAHALNCADTLLTRDRGFYRQFYKGLKIASFTPS